MHANVMQMTKHLSVLVPEDTPILIKNLKYDFKMDIKTLNNSTDSLHLCYTLNSMLSSNDYPDLKVKTFQ